jgi:hypothetical protein
MFRPYHLPSLHGRWWRVLEAVELIVQHVQLLSLFSNFSCPRRVSSRLLVDVRVAHLYSCSDVISPRDFQRILWVPSLPPVLQHVGCCARRTQCRHRSEEIPAVKRKQGSGSVWSACPPASSGTGRRRNEKLKIFKFNVMILCTKIVIVFPSTETIFEGIFVQKISVTLNSLLERERTRVFLDWRSKH